MRGEWRLEYVDSNGCKYEGSLKVDTQVAEGIYKGRQAHTMTCSGALITQEALITVAGAEVKINFSNPSAATYNADSYYLKRVSSNLLKGFNKDTRGSGRDVLLIRNN